MINSFHHLEKKLHYCTIIQNVLFDKLWDSFFRNFCWIILSYYLKSPNSPWLLRYLYLWDNCCIIVLGWFKSQSVHICGYIKYYNIIGILKQVATNLSFDTFSCIENKLSCLSFFWVFCKLARNIWNFQSDFNRQEY